MAKNPFVQKGYSSRMPLRFCPSCFQMLTGVTNMTGPDAPQAGDYTICITCASVLRFTASMDFELSRLEDIPPEYRFNFAKVVMAVKKFRAGKPQ